MSCEEEFNALRQAEWELAAFRKRLSGTGAEPGADVVGSETEDVQRMAELTAAVRQKHAAYDRCRGRTEMEALMRDETGAPLGGGAGPPM
jgi:hypothetical protein